VSIIVCTEQLVPEGGSVAPLGQTLRLSYQLKDATGRTAVDTSLLSLQPLLTYARTNESIALPQGVNSATGNKLPGCAAIIVDPASGVGECSVLVDTTYFPAAGALTASIELQIVRSRQVAAAGQPHG